jgi:predicted transcriptional regulator of viral defense system
MSIKPQKKSRKSDRFQRAVSIFKQKGGVLKTAEILKAGIHPSTLYALVKNGKLERISHGVYRLTDSPPLTNPDLTLVAKRIPKGVICLLSALSFHNITTHIPHEIHIALSFGAEEPRLEYPPIRTFRFSNKAFTEGIQIHRIDREKIRVYSAEKTLADCFKFRNTIGLDTAIEALKLYRDRKDMKIDELMHFAKICRMTKIMRPYLEALL